MESNFQEGVLVQDAIGVSEHQAIYRAIVETPAAGFWMVDTSGRLLEVNDAYCKLSGYTRDELLKLSVFDLEAKETATQTASHLQKIWQQGFDRFRSLHRRKDGSVYPVEIMTTLRRDIGGGRYFVFVEDIAEKVTHENELQIAAAVLETMDQAVLVTDAKNRIVSVNPALTRITGYTLEELRGKNPQTFSSGRHDNDFYRGMWHALNTGDHWEGEIWDRKKSGEIYAKWLTINVLRDAEGQVSKYIAVFADITEKKRSEELIWHQANFCALTDLPNRRMFIDRVQQEIIKSRRVGHRFAVLYIDLDNFKEINDTLGHSVGDVLLCDVAKRLASCVRETDTVARLGGDEFTVLLGGIERNETFERIAQEIFRKFEAPFDLATESLHITPSIGVTFFPEDAEDAESLLKNADQAMYAAKKQGRNSYQYFTPEMQLVAKQRMSQLKAMRLALVNREFRVFYQPVVDLANNRICKAEALVRWMHPQRGLIGPGEFIGLAEESGLIIDLGDWVFDEALRQVADWRARFDPEFQISINKSPVQFRREGEGSQSWPGRLASAGTDGQSIVVEITESSLMENNQVIESKLVRFRDHGIQVALDDFGTGYSSLSYIKRFHIDYIKIDQSFVRNMTHESDDLVLCEAMIMMAHRLGIKVVAEGVETDQQCQLLKDIGCDYAQGYLFSRPVPVPDFEQLFACA